MFNFGAFSLTYWSLFTFFMIFIFGLLCPCPNGLVTSNIAPAHPHATSVAVYPVLFNNELMSVKCRKIFEDNISSSQIEKNNSESVCSLLKFKRYLTGNYATKMLFSNCILGGLHMVWKTIIAETHRVRIIPGATRLYQALDGRNVIRHYAKV